MKRILVFCVLLIFSFSPVLSSTATATNKVTFLYSNESKDLTSVSTTTYNVLADVPPDILYEAKKRGKKVKRVATELQTENSKHYEINDGSMIAEYFSGTPFYQDEKGVWHDVDTRITDIESSSLLNLKISKDALKSLNKQKTNELNMEFGNYRALQVPFGAIIPKDYSKGYQIDKNESQIKLIPIGADSVTGTIYKLNGVKYKDVWESTDVTLSVMNNGLKEDIILKDPRAPTRFSFELQGDIDPESLKSENLQLLSPWLMDSQGKLRNVTQSLRNQNDRLYLDLSIDATDLEFPVIIDPTILTYGGQFVGSGNGRIQFDYYESLPSITSSFGNNGYILLFKYYNAFNQIGRGTGEVTFELSPFPVDSSKIQFAYLQSKYNGNGSLQVVDIGYSFYPYPYDAVFGTVPSSIVQGTEGVASFDVTNAIKAWFSSYKIDNYYNDDILFTLSTESVDSSYQYMNWAENMAKMVIGYNLYAPGTAAITAPQNGTVVDSNYNITWNAAIDQDDPQSSLKYHIQLSTNGGSTWSDIAPLTAAGASSYNYNFSSIANTTNAIIRIRSFDGIDYGSWMQSPTFTIKHNTAPNAPTGLNPGSTNSATPQLVGTVTPALNWTFSDPDAGDTQGQYEVFVYNGSTLVRDSGWISSSIASYTVPASTLGRNGTYNWQVRTKDNKGAISALSAKYYIKINNLPTVNISSYTNGQQVTDNILTFAWTYSDADGQAQSNYQIQGSQDNWATVGYNSGVLSGTATTFTTPPLASGTWSFKITAKDGLEWSNAATRSNLVLPNAYEPNDTTAQAYPVNYAQNYTSLISTAADIDFYKYTATSTGVDRFKLTVPSSLNYDVYVYDTSMNLIAAGVRGTSLAEDIIFNVTANATYYIKIVGVGGNYSASANYSFSLNRQATQFTTTYQYDFNGNITGKNVTITN